MVRTTFIIERERSSTWQIQSVNLLLLERSLSAPEARFAAVPAIVESEARLGFLIKKDRLDQESTLVSKY